MERDNELVRFVTRIEMARRERQELSRQVADATGVTLNQALVLSEVEHDDGQATVTALAARLARAVHTLTSAINGLERKGLVARTTLEGEDRRIIRIAITREGSAALARFRNAVDGLVTGLDTKKLDREPPEEVRQSSAAVLRLLEGPRQGR